LRAEVTHSRSDVTMNRMARVVVIFDRKVAAPRGPKVDWEPYPPNAPARSALFPLCNRTITMSRTHTTMWINSKNPVNFSS